LPHGQVVTIFENEVDFGGGPELLTFDFRTEAAAGIRFRGYRRFTLLEFFDPRTKEVISRNVITAEVPVASG
jgi:hypothetical protein